MIQRHCGSCNDASGEIPFSFLIVRSSCQVDQGVTLCFTFLCFSEGWRRRRRRREGEARELHGRRHFHPQSETAKVASEENELEDSVKNGDREGLNHDLEDKMWSQFALARELKLIEHLYSYWFIRQSACTETDFPTLNACILYPL